MSLPRPLLVSGLVALCLTAPAPAQRSRKAAERPAAASRVDPYTSEDPETMQRAGVVRYAPFMLGPDHDTLQVDELLGGVQVLWMETAHFRLGSSLPGIAMPKDPKQRRKIRAELEVLHEKLPRARTDARTLDPWLRMHLLAQRVEEVYADFQRRLDVTDADFPRRADEVHLDENYMGLGPYLGQADKYVVLITQRESSLGRYMNKYLGGIYRYPKRHNYGRDSGLLFCTATEFDGWLDDDTALHCHIAYNVVQNLCDGFKHYGHDIPVWFKCGLAQWYLRRIDPRYNNYDRPPKGKPDGRPAWDWEPTIAALVGFDAVRPIREMIAWQDYAEYKFADYIVNWSRIDYLMSLGDAGFSTFLHRLKTPITDGRSLPSHEAVVALQEQAMREAWGFDPETFDRRWRDYVTRTYAKKH